MKRLHVGFCMLLLISSMFNGISFAQEYKNESPTIHEKYPFRDWWIQDRSELKKNEWKETTRLISKNLDNNPVLLDYYTTHYVNPYNNTVFIVLKDSETWVNDFFSNMNTNNKVTIIFRSSKASYNELTNWTNCITHTFSKNNEYNAYLTSVSITCNGTLAIGVDELSGKINIIVDVLKGLIPLSYLELYDYPMPIVDLSQSEITRPLISGLKLGVDHDSGTGWATLGFYVTWNDGQNHGFLTNAHVAENNGSDIYQPNNFDDGYYIGKTIRINDSEWSYSDSALVELNDGIFGFPQIWDSTSPLSVDGIIEYSSIDKYDDVVKTGAKTGTTEGSVLSKGAIYNPEYGWLYNQVTALYTSDQGDSGSPVYMEDSGDIIGCGIHWGHNLLGHSFFSALDMIEIDLGFDDGDLVYNDDSCAPAWSDDFSVLERNQALWGEIEIEDGSVSEVAGQLWTGISLGTEQSQAGYITRWKYPINKHSVEIDVTEFNDLDEMILFIGEDNITSSDPYTQTEWYRCLKSKYTAGDFDWYVQKKMDGVVTTVNQDSTSGSYSMKIGVDDGYILFYEDNSLRYVEEYDWEDEVTCAFYTSTLSSRNSGYDKMDNFEYNSFSLSTDWYDNFNDGTYTDGWDILTGAASASGGKLRLSSNGNIVTESTFSTNRYVKADIKTVQNGTNHWEVGWLQAKYEDWDNQVYALIWPDGTVELGIRYNGNQNGWATSPGIVSNPIDTYHEWEFIISGDYAILKIDSEIIFNEYHDNFGDIQGKVGLRAGSPSIADYDNIVIIDE